MGLSGDDLYWAKYPEDKEIAELNLRGIYSKTTLIGME